jgi:hypothetical protein
LELVVNGSWKVAFEGGGNVGVVAISDYVFSGIQKDRLAARVPNGSEYESAGITEDTRYIHQAGVFPNFLPPSSGVQRSTPEEEVEAVGVRDYLSFFLEDRQLSAD